MLDIASMNESGAWRLEAAEDAEGIAFLVFDLPGEKVNKLTSRVLEDLDRILDALARDSSLKALVVVGGKPESGTFIAGADIGEIRSIDEPEEARQKASKGQAVLHRFSTMPAVTVAAIHGNCLGGGTELALACDLRVASHSEKTRIGLPEVQLGILPGFGGSQRLPRLVGLVNAMPIVLTGKPVDVKKASKIGLVDRVAYPDLLRQAAVGLALEALAKEGKNYRPRKPKRPFAVKMMEKLPPGRSLIARKARKNIEKKVGSHYPAPYKAIEAMVEGYGKSLEAGLRLEAKLVGELIASPVTKNIIDLFLTSEAARRGPKRDADKEWSVTLAEEGRRVAVLGAGVMGGGLAALISRRGFRVRMKDIANEAIQTGFKKIRESFDGRVKRRRMTRSERDGALARITASTEYSGFQSVDLIVEAVVENMDVKKQVLADVEEVIDDRVVFASNTSALSITEMQSGAKKPERVVGLHFFNPVERMPLVEVIRGEQSSDDAVEAVEAFARKLGKVPVRCGDGPGFLVNRVLGPYLNEAARLFEEGYSPTAIDAAIRHFGMPMGPYELIDEVGLDVACKVGNILHEAFGERAKPPEILNKLTDDKKTLGKKTGRGFYIHKGKNRQLNSDLLKFGGAQNANFKEDDPDLWVRRLIYPMVNEAARALDEKIVAKPSDVDLAMVFGTGFAPFRGGPLRFADRLGVALVQDGLESLREPRLVPCELIKRLAKEKKGFYETLEPNSESERVEAVEKA